MGRPLRFVRRGEIVEVTTRTIQGRLLTRPSKDLNEIFLGIVGRALVLYPDIKIFCIVVLSNHYHMLLKTPDGKLLREFMNFVNGNLGKKVGRLHSWREKFWGSRYRCIPVVDDDAVLKRFRYILAQGCKEGLVASPKHWPGVTCVPALVDEVRLSGWWFDHSAEYRARRRGETFGKYEYATEYAVPISPLPQWARLPSSKRRQLCADLVREIENETRRFNKAAGRKPLGVRRVCRAHPHGMPKNVKRSNAPLCHASARRVREAYKKIYDRFVEAFRFAADDLAEADNTAFPLYSFPPPLQFVSGLRRGMSP